MSDVTPSDPDLHARLRQLPSVDQLLAEPNLDSWPHELASDAARQILTATRTDLLGGFQINLDLSSLAQRTLANLEHRVRPTLQPVINATGVVLHTNLGRAPVSAQAALAMQRAAQHYASVEFDLLSGDRGSRSDHLDQLLQAVTGAEAGIAVNNNAAALYLTMSAHAKGKSVAVSRGQAVEIGGGFRIPDVIRDAGAQLIDVGTTNRTRASDYREATIGGAAILRVHSSNFRMLGFTEEPSLSDLRQVADQHEVLLIDDVGSGALLDTRQFGLTYEPRPQDSIAAGADLVLFSGDKLLGGPQAGMIVGKRSAIDPLRRHPLMRVLRLDKTAIAGLAATLRHYVLNEAIQHIPVWQMIALHPDAIKARAQRWRTQVGAGEVLPSTSPIGGGSLPSESRPTFVWSLDHHAPHNLARELRRLDRPVIGRIEHDRLLLDPRTVDPSDDPLVATALRSLLEVAT